MPSPNFMNSTFVNIDSLRPAEPHVEIHPKDAGPRGIESGQMVRIYNDRGEFFARAQVGATVHPGVVVTLGTWWKSYTGGRLTCNAVTSTRLTDMGVENYLIVSSLVAVMAQRLVRVICEECKTSAGTAVTPEGETIGVFRGSGFENCYNTGYHGRVGIFELMELNEELRASIMRNEDASLITTLARRNGMHNLREDGWDKVRRGVTTADEVLRVTQEF
jgi:hypothetical protein